ncbi:MAG: 50S ribosomal protein L6, large subunit ribosomal protein L6 [Candidatus Peregrinibacteria bacterium GW2011_GWF2_43_17]|nr:MAG: 50S ribosomal protein L6, large subunit ribosomal protein L6 [Candidatus Peregrinibacteria bacterium GW2011_GWF2_43_17]KKT19300.1 MAG: 50S ribosomal protein L6 [Candidatus Peregrinibacteria bacterium GW2011_GWA2_43_8]HAU40192.1 50S ribosomal protein L6 [Candidatus Peregrinibacteria bacterium]
MSRIGRQPVIIPSGVTVTKDAGGIITVKGPKGELKMPQHELVEIEIVENQIKISRKEKENPRGKSIHGLTRALLKNMVEGVVKEYQKRLEIIGVGYKAQLQGRKLILSLGYSHPVEYIPAEGIKISLDEEKKNVLIISGINKEVVGQTAAVIRAMKKPEPYKGKGIRYENEHVRRKAGKAVAKAAA